MGARAAGKDRTDIVGEDNKRGDIRDFAGGRNHTVGGEVFRERPLKKLFGTLRGFSAYRADAGRVRG